jgi:TfoX/Sxy family transcriptional regulator of competence genes
VQLLERATRRVDCEKRSMFGFPVCFANAHMFAGLFESRLFVRLPEQLRTSLEKQTGPLAHLEPMPGRPTRAYYVIPPSFHSNEAELAAVLAAAAAHARTLPAKAAKRRPTTRPAAAAGEKHDGSKPPRHS